MSTSASQALKAVLARGQFPGARTYHPERERRYFPTIASLHNAERHCNLSLCGNRWELGKLYSSSVRASEGIHQKRGNVKYGQANQVSFRVRRSQVLHHLYLRLAGERHLCVKVG